jgi:hypothetical protein
MYTFMSTEGPSPLGKGWPGWKRPAAFLARLLKKGRAVAFIQMGTRLPFTICCTLASNMLYKKRSTTHFLYSGFVLFHKSASDKLIMVYNSRLNTAGL